VLWLDDFMIELVEYSSPRGKPRRHDCHIGDAGIFHFGLEFPGKKTFKKNFKATINAGHSSFSKPVAAPGVLDVVYAVTDQGFIMEYMNVHPLIERFFGYKKVLKN